MASYELYLTDDSGRRLELLKDLFFFSYTRTLSRLGTINIGLVFEPFRKKYNPFYTPDWRIEVWRSPDYGLPLRREDVFMLRKPNVYTRADGLQLIQFYGRNGMDLLLRRSVIQRAETTYATKTTYADNMMKEIVREQMLYGSTVDQDGVLSNTRAWPQNEFTVQGDQSLGPTLTRSFVDRKVVDVLKEIQAATFQLHVTSSTNKRIFFDVVPVDVSALATTYRSIQGWEFRTYAGLYGQDRTQSLEFSLRNENMKDASYALNQLEEVTSVIVKGNGQGVSQAITSVEDTARLNASRWNRVEAITSASNETTTTGLEDAGRAELYKNKPKEELAAVLLNTPKTQNTPRSLYGVDWDLGDLVRVNYAGLQFNMEINNVYVAVDENGKEEITGRNQIE